MQTGPEGPERWIELNGKTLVAYFSASGTTARVAERIADATGADLYEIRPAEPYTEADLDWTNKSSRSTLEMKDKDCRPAIAEPVEDMSQYDTVFLGFPVGGTSSPVSWTRSWTATICQARRSSRSPRPAAAASTRPRTR